MNRGRWITVGAVAAVAVVAFLLFRPDTLVTEVVAADPLEEAFPTTTSTMAEETTTTATITTIADTTLATTTTTVPESTTTTSTNGLCTDTDIQNGPDLYVWLLPSTSYEGGTPAEYIDLGFLQGTVGGQNYDLPDEFDPDVHRTVLIWCLRFAVPFATAPLS